MQVNVKLLILPFGSFVIRATLGQPQTESPHDEKQPEYTLEKGTVPSGLRVFFGPPILSFR